VIRPFPSFSFCDNNLIIKNVTKQKKKKNIKWPFTLLHCSENIPQRTTSPFKRESVELPSLCSIPHHPPKTLVFCFVFCLGYVVVVEKNMKEVWGKKRKKEVLFCFVINKYLVYLDNPLSS